MAQSSVDDSTLEIEEMEITDPRPDGAHLRVRQRIGSSSRYHPWMDAFNASLSLEGTDEVFSQIHVPRFQASDQAVIEFEQDIILSDVPAFTEFSTAILHEEEIQLHVFGETQLKQGGLHKVDVTYDKIVTMAGALKNDQYPPEFPSIGPNVLTNSSASNQQASMVSKAST
jgi:hypothetical protein